MAKPKPKQQTTPPQKTPPDREAGEPRTGIVGPALYALGIVGLVIAMGASGALIVKSFTGAALAGCGAGGGCDQVYQTWAGRIPGTAVSVSVPGFAFFLSALVWWAMSTKGVSNALRWWARLGGLASVFYIIVMFMLKSQGEINALCVYCLAAHIGNFVFVAACELRGRSVPTPALVPGHALAAITALVVVGGGLAAADQVNRDRIADKEEDTFTDNWKNGEVTLVAGESTYGPDNLFTGRYIHGPEQAKARIVIFSDYQCPDCRQIEKKVFEVLAKYPNDVHFSAKHSPMDGDCNVNIRRFPTNKHPSACESARLAEAAGLLGGPEAFYSVHEWLFDDNVKGQILSSTPSGMEEVGTIHPSVFGHVAGLTGLDPVAVQNAVAAADDNGINAAIESDIDEAQRLGLFFTPMVFVNGKQVKAFRAFNYGAIERAVEAVLAEEPPAKGPGGDGDDRPAMACEKWLDDYYPPDDDFTSRSMAFKKVADHLLLAHPRGYARGADESAPIVVHFWGNLALEDNRKAARAMVDAVESRGDVRFIFHHYGMTTACNPENTNPKPEYAQTCLASWALEAAGQLGGEDAFWAMFDWQLDNATLDITEADLRDAARAIGLDPGLLVATVNTQSVQQIVSSNSVHYRTKVLIPAIPGVVVNGYRASKATVDGCPDYVDRLLERALTVPR